MRKKGPIKYKWHITIMTLVFFCLNLGPFPKSIANATTTETQKVKVRFDKGISDLNYAEWDIWNWVDGVTEGIATQFTHSDEKGVYALLEVPTEGKLGLIVRKNDWSDKAYSQDYFYNLSDGQAEIVFVKDEEPKIEELYKDFNKVTVNVNYKREDGDYDKWNLWNWIPGVNEGSDETVVGFTEENDFGKAAKLEFLDVKKTSENIMFIVRTNDWQKDGEDRKVDLAYANCNGDVDVYVNEGDSKVYYSVPEEESEDTDKPEETGRTPVLVGDLQDEISDGEEGQWNPNSTITVMKELGDGFYSLTATLPAGKYEYKVALNGWDEAYGVDGGNDNIKVSLEEETKVTFYYSDKSHKVVDSTSYTSKYPLEKQPRLVGTIQTTMGETADWAPDKSELKLYDHNFNGIYTIDLNQVPKGAYEFKVVCGNTWGDDAYGLGSDNFKLNVAENADVTITFNGDSKEVSAKVFLSSEFDGMINGGKLYHDTWDSMYRYPFGAVKEGKDVTLRLRAAKGDLQYSRVLVRNTSTGRSDLYNMKKVSTIVINEEELDVWEVTFTAGNSGVCQYQFVTGDGNATTYYGDDGKEGNTGAAGDRNIPYFQLTVYDKNYKTPDWMKESTVMQIFPDRFFNGDKTNDDAKENARGDEPIEVPESWDSLPDDPDMDLTGAEFGDGIWSNDFFGGDIEGIHQKLDYIQSLGVNTLYLNPITMAASNHKYDATDYKTLDPMFGTEAEFKAFTAELKNRDMHLIVDGVFNHVGDESIYFDRYGKYEWVGAYEYWTYVYDQMNDNGLSEKNAREKADKYFVEQGQKFSDEKWHLWFNIKNEKIDVGTTTERYDYQAWWGFDSLPEFKSMEKDEAIALGLASSKDEFVNKASEFNNKELVDYIYKAEDSVAKQWINWGADGWRLDVANEVETTFWNDFRHEMKAHNSETLILGEIWDDASKYFIGDQYDSVMNYRIRGALIGYLKNGDAEVLNNTLMAIYEDYPQEAFYALMNLMSSHDVARAVYVLGDGNDAVNRAEDDDYNYDLGQQRLMLAALFEFGYAGAPTVYYGDEAGVTGSADPDCRRTYPWGNEDKDLVKYYSELGKTRENNRDLFAHGSLETLYCSDSIYAYGRSYDDDSAIVITNPTSEDKTVTIDLSKFVGNSTSYKDSLSDYEVVVKEGKVEITVPAMTGRILINENTVILPDAVTNIEGTEGVGEVTLTWDEVSGATKYNVYISNFKGSMESFVVSTTEATTVVKDLVNGDRKYFAVTAVDANGNESVLSWSDALTPHGIIAWAGNLSDVEETKVDIFNKINVTAQAYIDGLTEGEDKAQGLFGKLLVKYPGDTEFTEFKAAYKGEVGKNDEFTASFIANKPGKYEYTFEFTSKGIDGQYEKIQDGSKTFTLEVGDETIVADSITLQTPEQQSGEVNLNWSVENGKDIALYEIIRDGVVIARIADGTLESYRDTDVTNKTTYTYKVVAYSNGGKSVSSNEVEVTPDLVMVEVTFKLKAPAYTPLDAKVTMPGAMNGWNAGAWEMSRNGAVTTDWSYTVSVMEGETIEYKYIKGGDWDQEALMKYSNPINAEKSKYGCSTGEGNNEKIMVENQGDGKMVVENEVIRWKDMPMVIFDPSSGSTTKNEKITIKGNAILGADLTIAGENVAIDENGNFAHETTLEDGLNNINIHVEPTEESKNNPDIFNGDERTIAFATKDLSLEITKLANGEEPTNPDEDKEPEEDKNPDGDKDPDGDKKPDGDKDLDGDKDPEKPSEPVNPETEKPGTDEDGNEEDLPQTGGVNSNYIILLAVILVCVGGFIVLKKRKKQA